MNCRKMEFTIFPTAEVSRELSRFVEIRLHTDLQTDAAARFRSYQEHLTRSLQLPNYVIIDPKQPEEAVSVLRSATLGEDSLLGWLRSP